MSELYVDYPASTTVAAGGYTAGSGVLNVASTAAPFPTAATFRVVIQDPTTGTPKVLLKVTAINSATQWAVTAEGTDASALLNDNVYAVLSAGALDQIRADMIQVGAYASLPSPTAPGQKQGNIYVPNDAELLSINSGSAWQKFGPVLPLIDPTAATLTSVQANGETITRIGGVLNFHIPDPNSGLSTANLYVIQSAGVYTAPKRLRVALTMLQYAGNGINVQGLGVIAATGTSWIFFDVAINAGQIQFGIFHANNWTPGSTFTGVGGNVAGQQIGLIGMFLWMEIFDDGTNLNFNVSGDGFVWQTIYKESRTALITPNQMVIAATCGNGNYENNFSVMSLVFA